MSTAVFAVTTRSGLRGYRFFPLMFIASRRIRRQLGATPGCVRFASIIAGPREFWTITVWRTRDEMLDFMRSGAHEDIMWLFGKWLRSFWLMRWRPTEEEVGAWSGASLARVPRATTPRQLTQRERAALESAFEFFPRLAEAVDEEGVATYDTSPAARRHERAVAGAGAVLIRIEAPHLWQLPAAGRTIRRLSADLAADPALVRHVTGVGKLRERFLLAVLRDDDACSSFLYRPAHQDVAERWGAAYWAMRWQPANEFGHWDGVRLRREMARSRLHVPGRAARAAGVPPGLVHRHRDQVTPRRRGV